MHLQLPCNNDADINSLGRLTISNANEEPTIKYGVHSIRKTTTIVIVRSDARCCLQNPKLLRCEAAACSNTNRLLFKTAFIISTLRQMRISRGNK
jgi:hypothetical protein